MTNFFISLDSIGFKSAYDIEALQPSHDKESTQKVLNQSLPKNYLYVIKDFSDTDRRKILLEKANRISLFIKTKFGGTNIFSQWSEMGTIPHYYHSGLNTKTISFLAKNILRLRKRIGIDEDKIVQLESIEKATKKQTISLEKASDRISNNKKEVSELESDFYFEFVDFESSLGGIY